MRKLGIAVCLSLGLAAVSTQAANHPNGLKPIPGSFMVTLETTADRPALRGMVRAFGGEVKYEYVIMPNRINVRGLPPGAEQALAQAGGVLSVTPDYEVQAHMGESLPIIGAEPVIGSGGAGVNVCVLDTGINPNHVMYGDTPSRIVEWKDFVNGLANAYDDEGHGSHVAGVVAGRTGLSVNGAPFHGVSPAANLYIGKVLDSSGSGSFSDVHAGIEWCAGLAGDSPSPAADVINMSLGGGAFGSVCDGNDSTGTAPVVNAAASAGVLVISSSGNEGNSNAVGTPACASGSMAIGATYDADVGRQRWIGTCTDRNTAADQIVCFSNAWDDLDVVAPGCITYSAAHDANSTVVGVCGTSQASPHVAGLAALVMEGNPGLTAGEVRDCINSTALDLGSAGFDRDYGHGRIQALEAVACNTTCTPTETPETSCSDGVDNDCDGATDGADSDCQPSCTPTENPEVSCTDGIDNDCDGDVDSADTDCQGGSCSLGQAGDACDSGADCCSGSCKGKPGSKTCK